MSSLQLSRWIIAAAITAVWAVVAFGNASVLWRSMVRKEDAPSMVPIMGFFLAIAATGIAPLEPGQRWPLVLAAAVLDVGSLPYLLIAAVLILKERFHRR